MGSVCVRRRLDQCHDVIKVPRHQGSIFYAGLRQKGCDSGSDLLKTAVQQVQGFDSGGLRISMDSHGLGGGEQSHQRIVDFMRHSSCDPSHRSKAFSRQRTRLCFLTLLQLIE